MMTIDSICKSPVLSQIDQLINWYEEHRPEAGQRIPVYVTPLQLARLLSYPLPPILPPGYKAPTEYHYRGRVLFCAIGVSP
jgi:hypothetical protein